MDIFDNIEQNYLEINSLIESADSIEPINEEINYIYKYFEEKIRKTCEYLHTNYNYNLAVELPHI